MTLSRFLWASAGLACALLAVNLLADRTPRQPASVRPVDTSAVDTLRDTIRVLDSASRHSLDSLREAFRRRPIREVLRYLPGHVDTIRGTLDTTVVESVLVPAPVIRETADSLATCRHDRDSVTRSVTLWQAREMSQREARMLCEAKPVPEQPSRIAWASAGAGAAILFILSIVILSR